MIIMEGTRFSNAVADVQPVIKLIYLPNQPTVILIHIAGRNPGYKVGDTVTYAKGETVFTGKVAHIYQGSAQFNLYVSTPNAAALANISGGVVSLGSVIKSAASTNPAFESAATILHDQEATQTTDVIGAPTVVVGGAKSTFQKYKVPIIILGVVAAGLIVWKMKGKGKGKK